MAFATGQNETGEINNPVISRNAVVRNMNSANFLVAAKTMDVMRHGMSFSYQ